MKLDEKKEIVRELQERFSKSKIVITTNYKGLDVPKISNLRRKLKESGSDYEVVKNTLLTIASKDTNISLLKDSFKGTTAIAWTFNDPVALAKALTTFAQDNDKLEIKSGVMGERLLDLSSIKRLAELPSREVLIAQFLGMLQQMPGGLVRALADVPRRIINVIQAIKEKKEKETVQA